MIIAIANQKGGVGKTTTCVNLGAALARAGRAVTLLDLDPQCNTTSCIGLAGTTPTIWHVLVGAEGRPDTDLAAAVVSTRIAHLAAVPGSLRLAAIDRALAGMIGTENRLRRALNKEKASWSCDILIDCPPNLGLGTLNALVAADYVLIPIAPDAWSLAGVGDLLLAVADANEGRFDQGIAPLILRTRRDGRRKLDRSLDAAAAALQGRLLTSVIRQSQPLADAAAAGRTIYEFLPHSPGAEDYAALAAEMITLSTKG